MQVTLRGVDVASSVERLCWRFGARPLEGRCGLHWYCESTPRSREFAPLAGWATA